MIKNKNNTSDKIIDLNLGKKNKERLNLFELFLKDLKNDPDCKELEADEQTELVKRIEKKDRKAEGKLIKSLLFLILKIAKNHLGIHNKSIGDLWDAGYDRVLKEIEKIKKNDKKKFDWRKENKFSTFVYPCIKGAIEDATLGKGDLEARKYLKKAEEELYQELQKVPTDQEVVDRMTLFYSKKKGNRRKISIKSLSQIRAKYQFNNEIESISAEFNGKDSGEKYTREEVTSSEIDEGDDIKIEEYEKITPEERVEINSLASFRSYPSKILIKREQLESLKRGREISKKLLFSDFSIEYVYKIIEGGNKEIVKINQKFKDGEILEGEYWLRIFKEKFKIEIAQKKEVEDFFFHKSVIDFLEILNVFNDFIKRMREKHNITIENPIPPEIPEEWLKEQKTFYPKLSQEEFVLAWKRSEAEWRAVERREKFFNGITEKWRKKNPSLSSEIDKEIDTFIKEKTKLPEWIRFYIRSKILYDEKLGIIMDLVGEGTEFPIKISDIFNNKDPNTIWSEENYELSRELQMPLFRDDVPYNGRLHRWYWWYYFRKIDKLTPANAYDKMRNIGFNLNNDQKEKYLKKDTDMLKSYEGKFLDK